MAGSIDHKAVWKLVRDQHNAISRVQLLQFGFTSRAIEHRIARGRLVVEWRGVYRVGRRPLDRLGRFMAAVLACGDGAVLSHESAANLWGIRKAGLDPIDVSIPANRRIRRQGIRVHRRNPMPPTDPLEAAINEADRRDLIRADDIAAALHQLPLFPFGSTASRCP